MIFTKTYVLRAQYQKKNCVNKKHFLIEKNFVNTIKSARYVSNEINTNTKFLKSIQSCYLLS